MTGTLTRVVFWSLALLGMGAAVGTAFVGGDFGLGVLAGGAVILAGLALSAFLSSVWLSHPRSFQGGLARFGLALKIPLLVAAVAWLFTMFPVLAVVLGASVLVLAIVIDALSARPVEV